jgi:hypothetical protein
MTFRISTFTLKIVLLLFNCELVLSPIKSKLGVRHK